MKTKYGIAKINDNGYYVITSNCTAQQLADKYGVSRSTIFRRLKNAKSKK